MAMPEEILFDIRLLEKHIKAGLTTRKDYQKWIKNQPDLGEQIGWIEYEKVTASGAQKVDKDR